MTLLMFDTLDAETFDRKSVINHPEYRVQLGTKWTVLCCQGLAAFLKAIGYLIPLMDAEYANYYTREVMLILIREFQSPDEEMKKIVLKVRCLSLLHLYTPHSVKLLPRSINLTEEQMGL